MSNVTTIGPRKAMTPAEREFLKKANRHLLDQKDGRIGAASFMDLVADWLGSKADMRFQAYAEAWIKQGGAKNKIAETMLRELFGLDDNEPEPRKRA
ncbi:hypothetical protein [Pseudomonas oryzihabitans]|uniref:hypothetical protein n=1 Tax=Pseudomonas oryzihabitans TaxID=47885 RepID=UPI0011236C2A|nr:hypothetical protein [Pseudomonas psychrotolerans]QDD91919.1 hypothetical protein CCZ28_24060 [Pseudomonas psychrotolerans]